MGVLFLVAVGLIVYFIVRNEIKQKPSALPEGETPLEIIKRRYAKGEISRDAYEQLKKDIL